MDFIKISPTTNFKLNRFWIRIELHFKFMCDLAYSLEFDLRLRSGQVCFLIPPSNVKTRYALDSYPRGRRPIVRPVTLWTPISEVIV
jgi:hypothetical protein